MRRKDRGLQFTGNSNLMFDAEIFPEQYARRGGSGKKAFMVLAVIVINIVVFAAYCYNDMKVIKADTDPVSSIALATAEPEAIEEEKVPLAKEPASSVAPVATPTPKMLDYLSPYYAKNKDLIGWLKIDDTPINNPVMFTPQDETYYLLKNFNKEAFKAGTLFIDDQSEIGQKNTNIIIYGHNMKNQTMFGSLKKYATKSYYNSHKTIKFDTLYETGTYQVMAAFYAKILKVSDTSFKYYQFTKAEDENSFTYFVKNIGKIKLYDTGVTASYGDRFITLSTCSYHTTNGRFVVVAKKIK